MRGSIPSSQALTLVYTPSKLDRIHGLVHNRWGCGLLSLSRLRLGFVEIVQSGWPCLELLLRLSSCAPV